MAISNDSSPLGQFRGSIGPYVLYLWNGKQCVKSKSKKANKRAKPKVAQQIQNNLFRAIHQFLKLCTDSIQVGFQMPKNADMSSYNAAMSYNLENAWIEEDKVRFLDLSKVKLSKPLNLLQDLWNFQSSLDAEGKLTLNWELNPFPHKETRMDDQVVFVFYLKDKETVQTSYNITRSSLTYTFNPDRLDFCPEIYCYKFLHSADKKRVSKTEFLGVLERQIPTEAFV